VKQQSTNVIVESAKGALCLAVLLACVWTVEAKHRATTTKEGVHRGIVKLTAVGENGPLELGLDIGKEL
jgi:hypothetical protein